LYIINVLVEEPMLVKTVSKATVSVERLMFFDGLSENTWFFLQEIVIVTSDNNMTTNSLRIFT